jgi:hypothetical protein
MNVGSSLVNQWRHAPFGFFPILIFGFGTCEIIVSPKKKGNTFYMSKPLVLDK